MNTSVQIIDDMFNPEDSEVLEGDDVINILQRRFDVFPETACLYFETVSFNTDVTPKSEEEVERLRKQPGRYIVVIYPAEVFSSMVYLIFAVVAVAVVAAVLLKPKIPSAVSANQRNVNMSSANNALANRTNEARPRARIPDIFGTVRAYPDLVQLPYSVYIDNKQTEFTLMCLGRGEYQVHDMRETDTPVNQIPESRVSLWNPNRDIYANSPNQTWGPGSHAGDYIWENHGISIVRRVNSVDGQTLPAKNAAYYNGVLDGEGQLIFRSNGQVETMMTDRPFGTRFAVGDQVEIKHVEWDGAEYNVQANLRPFRKTTPSVSAGFYVTGSSEAWNIPNGSLIRIQDNFLSGGTWRDLSGVYTITRNTSSGGGEAADDLIWTLTNASSVNANWNSIGESNGQFKNTRVPYGPGVFDGIGVLNGIWTVNAVSDTVITFNVGGAWGSLPNGEIEEVTARMELVQDTEIIGPFTVNGDGVTCFAFNFFAQQMYKDDGENQIETSVLVEATVTSHNSGGGTIGSYTGQISVVGTATDKDAKGVTLYMDVPAAAAYHVVSAKRITLRDTEFVGQVVDDVKWRDLYSVKGQMVSNFGNVTMLRVTNRATDNPLTGRERKLNCRVTRKVNVRQPDGNYSGLQPTNYLPDIFVFAARDTFIGNRKDYELDIPNIYERAQFAEEYFCSPVMLEFNYTFDNTGISFEETANMIAGAGLLTPYRQGQLIRFDFEYLGAPSKLLFNHRNKVPGSEKRSYQFINDNQYDGVEFTWVDPNDDYALTTLHIPDDTSLNPRKVESIGITNENQARVHAYRIWNRILYRSCVLEFEGLAESETVVPPNCIQVSDNTRGTTMDGYVVSVDGLQLTLSQVHKFNPERGYAIILQMGDGTLESFTVLRSEAETNIINIPNPTIFPILTDPDLVTRTLYNIVEWGDEITDKFIITERGGGNTDSNTFPIMCDNYDERYYDGDVLCRVQLSTRPYPAEGLAQFYISPLTYTAPPFYLLEDDFRLGGLAFRNGSLRAPLVEYSAPVEDFLGYSNLTFNNGTLRSIIQQYAAPVEDFLGYSNLSFSDGTLAVKLVTYNIWASGVGEDDWPYANDESIQYNGLIFKNGTLT